MSVNPDSIPRYGQPMDAPEPERTCGSCDHYTDVLVCLCDPHNGLAGICCQERDERGSAGELFNVDHRDEACLAWRRASL